MDKTQLITEIMELQRRLNRFMRQDSLDIWMGLNLTIPQLKSLFFIANEGNTSPGTLAAALRVTPSNVTGIIDRMVEQGLVSRQGNPEDRRVLLLRVTDKGRTIVANLRERRVNFMSGTLARLSLEELTSLARGLSALCNSANRKTGGAPQ